MKGDKLAHEATYKKKRVESLIHNNRLDILLDLFKKYTPSNNSDLTWADFGCSNGFICEEVSNCDELSFSKVIGYDHAESLLDTARQRNIPNSEFRHIDLNIIHDKFETYNLVSCFETLEHVGDYRNAFTNVYNATNHNGLMFIAVPNETGITGLIKFIGRYILRKNPYDDFFKNKSPLKYGIRLLFNLQIEDFRNPDLPGHGPHLGFDYRILDKFITQTFLEKNKLIIKEKFYTSLRMNVVYVFEKTQ